MVKMKTQEAIEILKSLDSLNLTPNLLKETQIGILVNKIRRSNDNGEELKKIAKDLVSKWKDEVINNKKRTSSFPEDTPKNPESDINKIENIANLSVIKPTGDSFRNRCVNLLYNALDLSSHDDKHLIEHLAVTIESLTHEECKGPSSSSSLYKSRIKSILFNLRDKNNPELRNSLISLELSPRKFAKLTTQQMASTERKMSVEKAKLDAMNESVAAASPQAETDMFQCGNCKQRRCKYSQMQTRSSDEPMTTFVTCLNCGKRWKFC